MGVQNYNASDYHAVQDELLHHSEILNCEDVLHIIYSI